MRALFDQVSFKSSKLVTKQYSTSFSNAVGMLSPSIRPAIYSIYGFVRFADEIVDTFHDHDKEALLNKFEEDYYAALQNGISLNPILNSFQQTVKKYNIPDHLVQAFLTSMKKDLHVQTYTTAEEINEYVYGSADVVGLMCLKVFVNGNEEKYTELKDSAMRLGSAFQKVNFLRDLRQDMMELSRVYFPGVSFNEISQEEKQKIIQEIEEDFTEAYKGIVRLPKEAKFGVYVAYIYYKSLLNKLRNTPATELMKSRIRVSNPAKFMLMTTSFVKLKLNLI